MKTNIHPKWFPNAVVTCQCGKTWTTGASVPEIRTEICSNCHPFFTGEQRIIDTEGRVDKFMKRLQRRDEILVTAETTKNTGAQADVPVTELGLSGRFVNVLEENNIKTIGELMAVFENGGDQAVLDINGIGQQALIDIKKSLRNLGFSLPTA